MTKNSKAKTSVLSGYHPVRYFQARANFIDKSIQALVEKCGSYSSVVFGVTEKQVVNSCQTFTDGRLQHIATCSSSELYPTHLRKLHQSIQKLYSPKEKNDYHDTINFLNKLSDDDYLTFLQYASLVLNGNNIFDFDKELLQIFGETDVDNVLLKDIRLPYPTVYLHFGKLCDKKVHGYLNSFIESLSNKASATNDSLFMVDGAYVSQCPRTGSLRFVLTSVKSKLSKNSHNCIDSYEDTMNFRLSLNSENITVREAAELERQLLFERNGVEDLSDESKFRYREKSEFNSQIDLTIDYLKFIVNCILYLQSYPEEIEEEIVQEVPKQEKGFDKVATSKNQPESRRIKFFGRKRQLFKQLDDQDVAEELLAFAFAEDKRSVIPHKRRAHLRKQRYGQGLQQWRFVWIKETTIHREKFEPVLNSYRIYEVVAENNNL